MVQATHEKDAASKYEPAAQESGSRQAVLFAAGIRGKEQVVHHAVPPGQTALGPPTAQGKQVAPEMGGGIEGREEHSGGRRGERG